jgi:hypothetical protein
MTVKNNYSAVALYFCTGCCQAVCTSIFLYRMLPGSLHHHIFIQGVARQFAPAYLRKLKKNILFIYDS